MWPNLLGGSCGSLRVIVPLATVTVIFYSMNNSGTGPCSSGAATWLEMQYNFVLSESPFPHASFCDKTRFHKFDTMPCPRGVSKHAAFCGH